MSWSLIWSDEFDGPAGSPPDPSKWFLVDDQNYESGTLNWYRPQNTALDGNSHVVITAKPEVYKGYAYTSGRMETQTAPLQNLKTTPEDNWAVESIAQIPTGKGLWPCAPFYLGADWNFAPPPGRTWPACGEIDHNEWYQLGRNQIRCNLVKGDGSWLLHTITLPFNIDEGQHVYRTECQGGEIRCLVDGVLYVTFQKATVPNWVGTYDQSFILIAQVEVGGRGGTPDATTPWPAQLIIDAVRIYAWVSSPPPPIGGTMTVTTTLTGSVLTFQFSPDVSLGTGVGKQHLHIITDTGIFAHEYNPAPWTLPAPVKQATVDLVDSTHVLLNNQHYVFTVGSTSPPPSTPPPTPPDPHLSAKQKLIGLGLTSAEADVVVNP